MDGTIDKPISSRSRIDSNSSVLFAKHATFLRRTSQMVVILRKHSRKPSDCDRSRSPNFLERHKSPRKIDSG